MKQGGDFKDAAVFDGFLLWQTSPRGGIDVSHHHVQANSSSARLGTKGNHTQWPSLSGSKWLSPKCPRSVGKQHLSRGMLVKRTSDS